MKNVLLAGVMLFGMAICVGCGPEVADPAESDFQGAELEAQMEYMKQQGQETMRDADPNACHNNIRTT
ncbi:MAG: hypothetical protein R3C05_20050 [Pirellulaceae bacterium]